MLPITHSILQVRGRLPSCAGRQSLGDGAIALDGFRASDLACSTGAVQCQRARATLAPSTVPSRFVAGLACGNAVCRGPRARERPSQDVTSRGTVMRLHGVLTVGLRLRSVVLT